MTETGENNGVNALKRSYLELQQERKDWRSKEKKMVWGLTALIVLFLFGFYSQIKNAYDPEKIMSLFGARAAGLAPEFNRLMGQVLVEVAPSYMVQGEKALAELLPELQEKLADEWVILWANMEQRVRTDMETALRRSLDRFETKLGEQFPEIQMKGNQERIIRELDALLKDDTQELIVLAADRYAQDMMQLYDSLDQFKPNQYQRLEQEKLMRTYLHLWLVLFDSHLLSLQ